MENGSERIENKWFEIRRDTHVTGAPGEAVNSSCWPAISEDSFQNTNEMSVTYNDLEEKNILQMGKEGFIGMKRIKPDGGGPPRLLPECGRLRPAC
jgi:hypothetical protein